MVTPDRPGRSPVLVAFAIGLSFAVGLKLGLRPAFGPVTLAMLALTAVVSVQALRSARRGPGLRPTVTRASALLAGAAGLLLSELALQATVSLWAPGLRAAGLLRPGDGPALLPRSFFDDFWAGAYDAELGWDQTRRFPPFGRARPAPGTFPTAWVGAFGESYTECKGPDGETWEAHLSSRLRTRVVNYGVAGYGPDQVLLKFRRVTEKDPPRVALFGYMAENIARLVNRYRFAYDTCSLDSVFSADGRPHWTPTKPRFVLRGDRLDLLPNPVQSRGDLERLLTDAAFGDEIAAADFFRAGYRAESLRPVLRSPLIWSLPRVALDVLARPRPPEPAAILVRDPEAMSLLRAILSAFGEESRSRHVEGVVVLFGMQTDLEECLATGKHERLDPVVAHLRATGLPFVDTVSALADHARAQAPPLPARAYFDDSSHHSLYAHRVLAEVLATWLEVRFGPGLARLEAEPTGGAEPSLSAGRVPRS